MGCVSSHPIRERVAPEPVTNNSPTPVLTLYLVHQMLGELTNILTEVEQLNPRIPVINDQTRLNSLPDATFSEEEMCTVCLDDSINNRVVSLPCMHKYHLNCISTWLSTSNLCPVCKQEVDLDN